MMIRPLVLVFARAPRLGTVKRRLARGTPEAPGIGDRAALRFYAAQLATTLRALARDRRWDLALAITPDGARVRWPGPRPTPARVPQGSGDLGARMHRALRRRPRTVVVGSDIPELCATDIAAAVRALGRVDAVFGPALDGGYWLVALGPRRPAHPFAGVRWSTEHALADTLANFRAHRVALLRTLRDVDTAADLRAAPPTAPRHVSRLRCAPVAATPANGMAGEGRGCGR